jgi:hypothetical protein
MLQRIEGDNSGRVVELPLHQIGDDGFAVGPLDLGFAVDGVRRLKRSRTKNEFSSRWCQLHRIVAGVVPTF